MVPIVIILAVALAISFVFHYLNAKDSQPRKVSGDNRPAELSAPASRESDGDRATKLAGDLDKKRREIDELKASQNELKAELKDAKKKLYEAKEGGKGEADLMKARAEVERQASVQLDATRAELATALAEVTKLKGEAESGKSKRRPEAPAAAAPVAVAAAPVPAAPVETVVVQKVIRELSDADKAKMAELEQKAAKARYSEIELERELKQQKGRAESQARQLRETRKESQLSKDKFRAVEARLNRTLLERDMTVRALRILEKASGQTSERIELTAEEIADSDRKVAAQQAATEKVEAEARAKLEAAEAHSDAPAPAPSAPTPAAPTTPTA